MKDRSKYQRKIWFCRLIFSMLQILLFLFWPVQIRNDKTCGAFMIFTVLAERNFRADYLPMELSIVPIILYLIRLFLMLRGKQIRRLSKLPKLTFLWLGVSIFLISVFSVNYESGTKPDVGGTIFIYCIFIFLAAGEFLFCRYQETMEEQEEELAEIREKEKREKQHQKQADYFPGKYPKEFYQIIRKLFRSRMKVQVLMMLSEVFAAAYLFIVFSMYGIMKDTYAMESGLTGEGLYGLFRNLGIILMILSIVMMVTMSAWYMKEAKKDFRMLVILGIRRKTAYIQFLLEFWMGAVVSAVIGLVLGAVGAFALRVQLQKGIPNGTVFPEVVTGKYFGIGLLAYLILMILSLTLNQENFINLGCSVDRNEDVQKEKRLKRWSGIWMIGGAFFAVLAVAWYSIREWAESLFIHILTVLGIFFLLTGGMALWLRKREKKEAYYTGLAKNNLFYHRFWSNTEKLFFLAIAQFLALGIFAVSLAGAWIPQKIEMMYPYDIVVTAYEAELPELEKTAEKYGAEVFQYPMVRITSIYGSDELRSWNGKRPIQWPQGQQIAISESTYQKMREFAGKEPKDLLLEGEEMHVVYQQDLSVKSHTIDWDTARTEKHLRFGQPLQYYNPDDFRNVFPIRNIKSEERDSLIGIFHQGMQDNLVVLSDGYFRQNYDRIKEYNRKNWETRQMITREEWKRYTIRHPSNLTEGPTTLFCMNLNDGQVNPAADDLEYLKETHDFDTVWDRNIQPFYVKPQMIVNTQAEIFFSKIANGFILLVLLSLGVFQYFVKVKSEEDTWKWENTFLKHLGMHEQERKAKICYQMKFFILVPMMFGMIGGIIFGGMTAKARLYMENEIFQFAICLTVVYLIWILVWVLVYLVMKWNIWRYVEKE